jgi:hypothetical protein
MAYPDDLDAGGLLRSQEHLNALFEETTPAIMWDQFGVVGDALVSTLLRPLLALLMPLQ